MGEPAKSWITYDTIVTVAFGAVALGGIIAVLNMLSDTSQPKKK